MLVCAFGAAMFFVIEIEKAVTRALRRRGLYSRR
jgi:hypothetical protein